MSKLDSIDEAYDKGYDAARKGKAFKKNPYKDPDLVDAWNDGWIQGQGER